MGSDTDPAEQPWVVLATCENGRAAEHMLASLGRGFRLQARKKRTAEAFIIRGNRDGSVKVTESRVLSAGAVGAAIIGILLAILMGFMGLLASLRGAKASGHAARARRAHLEPDDRVDALLAQAGPHGALALVCGKDDATRQMVIGKASEHADACWDGSRSEFLDALGPGSRYDWVRSALGASVENNQ